MANDRADAGNTVAALALFGAVAAVVGTAWAFGAWPDGDYDESPVPAALALIVAVLGWISVLAAVTAGAVRLGIRWSGLRDEIVHELRRSPTESEPAHLDQDGL
ncbi:hypothetical protein [Nocardioides sp. URHA0020]|uniref:hypothetical protein n=1 Tax=Nocardioides sp. URHA0020 TaxID=1380392 RepID=UPI00048E9540|nr:hypothetical protein [Nocardioides sp. URHA0020]